MTAEEFRHQRLHLRWTQKDAAEALSLTVQQVSHIENGRAKVPGPVAMLLGLYAPGETPEALARIVQIGREHAGYPQQPLDAWFRGPAD